jgi:hypothetical protein
MHLMRISRPVAIAAALFVNAGMCAAARAQTSTTCSESTGRHCFRAMVLNGQAVTVSCGASYSLTLGQERQISIQVTCGEANVSVSMSHVFQATQVLSAGICEKCAMLVCFPSSTLSVKSCTFAYPDWDCPEPVCQVRRPCRYLGQ